MDDSTNPHEHQSQIDQIVEKALLFLQKKDYKKAAEIVKNGLEAYPKQEKLLNLYSDIKNQYKNEKIQKLQEEALMFMTTGAEDKAQEKLRQILQLDPTRTDLKESFQKSRGEVIADYNYRTERMQWIRLGSMVLLAIVVILCSIALWAWWSNDRYLKKSEKFIASGELYNARQALKKCGWFLAGKKQKVDKELQLAIDELIDHAHHCAELKDFQKAKEYLAIAGQAAENNAQIEEQIKKYDRLEQQWKEELAKQKEELARQKIEQEKQMVLSEKALVAKKEFQDAFEQLLESKADLEAKDAVELAKNKAQTAENMFSQNQFESAEKQWLSAVEDCKMALKIVEETKISKAAAISLKLKCTQAAESALKINAPAEASEIWQEAEKICNSAEQNFAQNNFDAAGQLWEQAARKYNEALQAAMQSPSHKKALLILKKWQHLKQGAREEEVRNILGSPKCVQAASDHCIWYYQAAPTASKIDEESYTCIIPQCGYVRFETISIETIIEANKKTYQKYIDDEQKAHESSLVEKAKKIRGKNRGHAEKSSKIRTGDINPNRSTPSSYVYRTRRERDEALQAENLRYNRQVQQIKDSKEKEEQRHEKRMGKLSKDLQTKIDNLSDGLFPIEPRYIVSDWILPDQNDLVSLLKPEEPNERKIRPPHKWQMPIKWKSLRLNIKEDEAYSILGLPQETSSEPGEKIYHYGKIIEYGSLTFEDSTDSFRRLRYWKEPLWAHVAQEVQSQNQLSDPNQDVGLDEPNVPNEPNEPDANKV